jgi:uncharacterized delta-60 repeat protein
MALQSLWIVALFVLVVPGHAHGQPSGLDTSFGTGGFVVDALGPGYGVVEGLTMDPDGSILAVGSMGRPGHSDIAVLRYSSAGVRLDAVTIDVQPGHMRNDSGRCIAMLPDRRIVIAGRTALPAGVAGSAAVVIRLQPSLAPDLTFGTGGIVISALSEPDWVHGCAVQPDGGVLVVSELGLHRFTAAGVPDQEFGSGGRVWPLVSPRTSMRALAVQPDGHIVVVGKSFDLSASELTIARYGPTGHIDPSFGSGGVVLLSARVALANAMVVRPDGRLVVAGIVTSGTQGDFALWGFTRDGHLDASFGMDGRVVTDLGRWDQALALALHGDGRLVAVGYSQEYADNRSTDMAAARYAQDGTLDTTFGDGGLVVTDFFGERDDAHAAVFQPGYGVVAGGATANPSTGSQDFALVRYGRANLPPTISMRGASPAKLWPVNHKFVDVTIDYLVTDDADESPTCTLAVRSNQPPDGRGDGRTSSDWQVTSPQTVRLRAERQGGTPARVYVVSVTCRDSDGLEAQVEVAIPVMR